LYIFTGMYCFRNKVYLNHRWCVLIYYSLLKLIIHPYGQEI